MGESWCGREENQPPGGRTRRRRRRPGPDPANGGLHYRPKIKRGSLLTFVVATCLVIALFEPGMAWMMKCGFGLSGMARWRASHGRPSSSSLSQTLLYGWDWGGSDHMAPLFAARTGSTSTTTRGRGAATRKKTTTEDAAAGGAAEVPPKPRKPRAGQADSPVVADAKLVIVESATKAQTIRKILPAGWDVDFCMGHVRELPKRLSDMPDTGMRKEKWEVLGVRVDKAFEPVWIVPQSKAALINRLKTKAKSCSELYLATDEDREGEAISWHLLQLLEPKVPVKRAVFHEITRGAVEEGLQHPRSLDEKMVEAQHARRVLDRVAGYTVSPVLWQKITTKLSAGRVQSAGLRLLVEKERERMRFHAANYTGLRATLKGGEGGDWGQGLEGKLVAIGGKKLAGSGDFDPNTGGLKDSKKAFAVLTEAQMEGVKGQLSQPGSQWVVEGIDTKVVTRKRPTPLITSTLQQEANRLFGFSSSKTMRVAQDLYEMGYITYMRTDSPNLSQAGREAAHQQAVKLYGAHEVDDLGRGVGKKNKASETAQEAHEAIRPSIVEGQFRRPEISGLDDKDQLNLYKLIFGRTLATVMKDAKIERKSVSVHARSGDGQVEADFTLSGQSILSHGFLRSYKGPSSSSSSDEDTGSEEFMPHHVLANLVTGDHLSCLAMRVLCHTTSPPYRYTQGSFVRALEELNIGRPSTYATIIEVLKEREYFTMKGTAMVPSLLGFVVIQLLEQHFPDVVDYGFTARMEDALDGIAKGNVDRADYLSDYYRTLRSSIDAVINMIDKKQAKRVVLSTLGDANCGIFVGPFGPYVRELLPGEPTDEVLLNDRDAATKYYIHMWQNEQDFQASTSKLRKTTLPPELQFDPSLINKEVLIQFLDGTTTMKKAPGGDKGTSGSNEGGADVVGVTVRRSQWGPVVDVHRQGGQSTPLYLPNSFDTSSIDVPIALRLFQEFPKPLGPHPTSGEAMTLVLGSFPHIRSGNYSFGIRNLALADALDMTHDKAVEVVATVRPTYDMGEHKGYGLWFVPATRQVRWNRKKAFLSEDQVGPDGIPTRQVAIEALKGATTGSKAAAAKKGAASKKEGSAASTKSTKSSPKASTSGGSKVKKASAPNPYLVFCQAERPKLPEGMSFGEKQAELGRRWRALSEEEKAAVLQGLTTTSEQ